MTDPTNGAIYRVIGMSRSGNHAIIGWLLRQLAGNWCFLNCTEPGTSPFASARPMDDGAAHLSSDRIFDPQREAAGDLTAKDHLLFSHEDVFLRPLFRPRAEQDLKQWLGGWGRRFDILILRDPFNLFASRRRAGLDRVGRAAAVRIWKQHARAFLGTCDGVPRSLVAISYNRWVMDPAYRQAAAARLGLPFSDQGIERVARCCGGSSFDGLAFDGRASRMRVLDRWRRYAGDADFRAVFDAEIRTLAEQAFGPRIHESPQDWERKYLEPLTIPAMN